MQKPIKVEFVPRTVTASAETIARRADTVQRLDNLGHVDTASGDLNTTEMQWCARINGTEVAVLDFGVQKLDDGRVAISLVAVADTVSIGAASGSTPTEAERVETERRRLVVEGLEFAQAAASARPVGVLP